MSRRRYLSTDISLDKRVNKLATKYGDFAVMLYTWMIPHAGDDAIINADPEELMFMVIPGRRDKNEEDIVSALEGMNELELIYWDRDNNAIYFPTSSFYKYQTYIKQSNRRTVEVEQQEPTNNTNEIDDEQKTPQNAEEKFFAQETAENTVSLSLSPSLSHSLSSSSCSSEKSDEGKLFTKFEESFAIQANLIQREKLSSYLDDGMEPGLIELGIQKTRENGKPVNYLWGILNNWIDMGIKTLKVYELQDRERPKHTPKSSYKGRGQPKKQKVPDYILNQDKKYHSGQAPKTESDPEVQREIERLLAKLGEG
ncbi:DnaD domain protein [Tepidibacillus marianensis]|uniref:DnaD domain protein n=1 Tax=Tepidibacillus marianensis TaxID=3131995 RepID=UPI0030CDCF09